MAFVKKGDVFVPELVAEPLEGVFAGMTVMRGTGAAEFKTGMPGTQGNVGELIKIPYFDTIGELEELTADGDALTPRGITDTEEQATIRHAGIAIEATWWAQASAKKDPYAEMARQIGIAVERFADRVLLDTALAAGSDVLTNDVYNAGVPVKINYDSVVDAKMLWGDEQDGVAAMVMNSKVKGDAFKLKDTQGRPLLLEANDGNLDRFVGMPLIVSDRLTASSDSPPKYTSLGLKRGSMVFWVAGAPQILEDKDILTNTKVMALHLYFAVHRYKRMPSGTKPGIFRLITN
jgi:hypothetical protein